MGNKFAEYVRYLLDCILGVIYCGSSKCLVCGGYVDEEEYICSECQKSVIHCLEPTVIEKDHKKACCYSHAYYAGSIMELILRFKYKGDFSSGEALGEMLVQRILQERLDFDVITFVPSTRESMKNRTYNQCEFLANHIGKRLHADVRKYLCKSVESKDQIGLNGKERWNNMKGTFEAMKPYGAEGRKVLLIDDVITTGATAFYCSQALMDSGAEKVTVLTVAKSKL